MGKVGQSFSMLTGHMMYEPYVFLPHMEQLSTPSLPLVLVLEVFSSFPFFQVLLYVAFFTAIVTTCKYFFKFWLLQNAATYIRAFGHSRATSKSRDYGDGGNLAGKGPQRVYSTGDYYLKLDKRDTGRNKRWQAKHDS